MRRMSRERRRVVVMAAGVASLSGLGPVILAGHPRLRVVWLAGMVVLLVWVIVLMVRLRRMDGCG
jgi:hypothetical protein